MEMIWIMISRQAGKEETKQQRRKEKERNVRMENKGIHKKNWIFSSGQTIYHQYVFPVWPMQFEAVLFWLWRTAAPEHIPLIFSLLFAVVVQFGLICSNTDRSRSNNQIVRLNKGIKMYTKKYYKDCFYIISNRKANIILSRFLSAFSKYSFI